jgi:Holliday junction resolvasome RuvABC endonuclease subunit
MNILCLDPADSTGYCLASIKDGILTIFDYGYIEISESEYLGDRCLEMAQKVELLINKHNIAKVGVEDYFFSSRFATGSNVNVAYRTAIHMKCREKGLHYEVLSVSGWKKFISGRSTPTKQQKVKWGKAPAKKLMIQESLFLKYGIRFPNHSISKKTGKPIKFKYDVVDAVGQTIYYARLFLDIQKVEINMNIPKDEDVKSLFNYGDYDVS